jgi:hypothetical protein
VWLSSSREREERQKLAKIIASNGTKEIFEPHITLITLPKATGTYIGIAFLLIFE